MGKRKPNQTINFCQPIEIQAAEGEGAAVPAFTVEAYSGGPMELDGYDRPVIVDLKGLQTRRVMVANLDHNQTQRVGNVDQVENNGRQLILHGKATASTPAREEVIASAQNGFQWQASIEAKPISVKPLRRGSKRTVNGQTQVGPAYIVTSSVLKGFAFVSAGADDSTHVSIAASEPKETIMDPQFQKWAENLLPSIDLETLEASDIANLEKQYQGIAAQAAINVPEDLGKALDQKASEAKRIEGIQKAAIEAADKYPSLIAEIKGLANQAIADNWTRDRFRLEMLEACLPKAPAAHTAVASGIDNKVLEAAACVSGRLEGVEDQYSEQVLEAAHKEFPHGIGLQEIIVRAAQANGYNPPGYRVDLETQRAAFGMAQQPGIRANQGFSNIDLPTTFANIANKFVREGWNAVDRTCLRIAAIRSVRDFKQVTTVSLTGGLEYEQVANDGQITHGQLGETVYTNQVDTYGRMFAITRQDLRNDDASVLSSVPRRLGRGAALKLNDIFWSKYLDNAAFFTAPRGNLSTNPGELSAAGLAAAENLFMQQTDPDGNPLGVQPAILLVPTSLRATASELMTSQLVVTGSDTTRPDRNIWQGRFTVESSPYMENSKYTGNSSIFWYLLASPGTMPVIEIAALDGRVEPMVDTAEAAFNTLGIQMRGYSDVGVEMQEYRGGVKADGSPPS